MKKVFISMPMNGKTDEEIVKEFKSIKKRVLELFDGCQVIDSVFSNFDLDNNASTPIHYLGRSIELLADADIVYFAKGWEKARGCLTEYQIAKTYGKTYVEEAKQEQKEPLIKDEKIRKAVRAWAEANDKMVFEVQVCYQSYRDGSWSLRDTTHEEDCGLAFMGKIPEELNLGSRYTIDELCGDEEE